MKILIKNINNKTFIYLSSLAFLVSKYSFVIFSKLKPERQEVVGFVCVSLIFVAHNALKAFINFTEYKTKFSEYFHSLMISFALIIIPILFYGIALTSMNDKMSVYNYIMLMCVLFFVFTVPFTLGEFIEFAQSEILSGLDKDMKHREEVERKFKNILIPLIIFISLGVSALFSFYSWS